MLTADLLQARVVRGIVRPVYLPREGEPGEAWRARAGELIALYEAHRGRTRGELEGELEARLAGLPDFRTERGLAKLLEDRSEFVAVPAEEAAARREAVFAAAARRRLAPEPFDRAAALAEAAAELGLAPDDLDHGLYGDLRENEVLRETRPIPPEKLIARYNVALAQAVLLRALELKVVVRGADPPRLRALLRHVKFQGLLTASRRHGDAVTLELDGPLSIFAATPRYGVRMAGFLPALLLCPDWELEARVQLGRARTLRRFRLGPEDALESPARDVGAWLPELIEAFEPRFREVAPGWEIDREVPLLHLGGEVIVPDFRFRHRESGFEAWLEVLGYWRKGGVARRLDALRAHDAPRLVLALDRTVQLGDTDLEGLSGPIVPFRDVPDARKVRKCLDELRAAAPHPQPGRRRRKRADPANAGNATMPPDRVLPP